MPWNSGHLARAARLQRAAAPHGGRPRGKRVDAADAVEQLDQGRIVIAQVNEVTDAVPRVDIPGGW